MLGTQLIIQMSDVIVGLFTVMVFLMIDVICSTENDVVMNVSFVNVGSYNVRVFSFQKFIGKLYADLTKLSKLLILMRTFLTLSVPKDMR